MTVIVMMLALVGLAFALGGWKTAEIMLLVEVWAEEVLRRHHRSQWWSVRLTVVMMVALIAGLVWLIHEIHKMRDKKAVEKPSKVVARYEG